MAEGIAVGFPSGDGRVELLGRREASLTEALPGQHAEFHLGHMLIQQP